MPAMKICSMPGCRKHRERWLGSMRAAQEATTDQAAQPAQCARVGTRPILEPSAMEAASGPGARRESLLR